MKVSSSICGAIGAAVLVLAYTSASAQVTPSGGGYLFRMKHVPGAKHRYNMRIETTGDKIPGGKNVMEMPFRWEVESVKGGKATLTMVMESLGADRKGSAVAIPLTMDARGVAVNTQNGQPFQRLGVVFPEKPLRIGESFRAAANASTSVGAAALSDVYTLKSTKQIGGRQVAVLAVTSKVNAKNAKGGGSGTMLIDMADGYMYRYDYAHKLTLTVGKETGVLRQAVTASRR